ncbi:MAG: hypothetical protein EDM74_05325 [Armatimonadetes bacterium]|nr:MAG: hypothetical protein EDM74_05325 [Armatimonadota bacterium]
MRLLIYECELHVARAFERQIGRSGGETRIVKAGEDLGAVFSEFDPTHVLAGTAAAFEQASALVEARGSSSRVARFR